MLLLANTICTLYIVPVHVLEIGVALYMYLYMQVLAALGHLAKVSS